MKYPQLVSMPSAVSDWLEEQLEARGIDAVLYTRYILSLLHSHPVDIIYPDEDLQYSYLNKEVRRQSGSRKRFRRGSSSDWWRHAQAEAERIKRSVAVECLMSASDQNCEIESLVDELCAKLKEVKSNPASPAPQVLAVQDLNVSPKELAEKYYAAFPPLKGHQGVPLMALVPKWKQEESPTKKRGFKKHLKGGYEQKLQFKFDSETMKARTQSKQRFSYLTRNKNPTPRKNDSFTGWDFNMFSTNKKLKPETENEQVSESKSSSPFDHHVSEIWHNNNDDEEEEMNMYDDLPVDIQLLLDDSPDPQDDTVEMMNIANMRDTGKRGYIPYGTNIISSIWSTDQTISLDNTFNTAADSDSSLDFKFSSITIDTNLAKPSSDWPTFENSENEMNSFFENSYNKRNMFFDGFRSLPGDWKEIDVEKENAENEKLLKHIAVSLLKLNHNKENSCFTEVKPKSRLDQDTPFNPFSRTTSMFNFNNARRSLSFEKDKEDLLTSEKSHFRPIAEKGERIQKQYEDGSTFIICNNLEKVDYKRTESGSMWLETASEKKRYLEYKSEDSEGSFSPDLEFVLKFSICQNDIGCQTDDEFATDDEIQRYMGSETIDTLKRKSKASPSKIQSEEETCTCPSASVEDLSSCPVHRGTNRSDSVLGEFLWKYEFNPCEKCNNNNAQWNVNWSASIDSEWNSENLRNIWNGGEVCQSCSNLSKTNKSPSTPPSKQNMQLREDISQDGEQLLSDLTNLQKCYMEELPLAAEMSCDINELVSKERKRRHSLIVDEQSSWSFASRLEEDCLIQMSTLPTLRSVTL